jgi:hypothetical protein
MATQAEHAVKSFFIFVLALKKNFFSAGSACTNSKISRVKTLKSVQKQNNFKFFYGKKLRESMRSKNLTLWHLYGNSYTHILIVHIIQYVVSAMCR